jgi:hypothetical protein
MESVRTIFLLCLVHNPRSSRLACSSEPVTCHYSDLGLRTDAGCSRLVDLVERRGNRTRDIHLGKLRRAAIAWSRDRRPVPHIVCRSFRPRVARRPAAGRGGGENRRAVACEVLVASPPRAARMPRCDGTACRSLWPPPLMRYHGSLPPQVSSLLGGSSMCAAGSYVVVDDGAIRLHCSSLSQSRFLRATPIPQRIKGPRNQDLVSAQQINEF